MDANRLLALYDKVAEAPGAIPRLRRFVLDLAVRGKLVEQNPKDEPAAELLKRIEVGKKRLMKAGKFHEPRNSVKIQLDDLPFVPPTHWVWARLIEIAKPAYGFAFKPSGFNSTKRGMPLIRIRDISNTDTEAYYDGDYASSYLVRNGDYLVGMDGNFNLRKWQGSDALLNQRVMRINGWLYNIDPEFVKFPLQIILNYLHSQTSLTTVKHLSAKQVNGIKIPLPPLPEQHRIVAKVEELMTLLDQLETARTTREATRDRLTTATLTRLTAPETSAKDFFTHARFALNALPTLTTRPNQIKLLRQTILNLAVRGKLVPQNPKDEPAVELLKRIEGERVRLVKAGKIKNRPNLPAVEPTDEAYTLPHNWKWVRFGNIVDFSAGHTPPRNDTSFWNTGDYAWISIADIKDGETIEITKETVSEKARNIKFRSAPKQPGMMIMSFKLTIGKIARLGIPAYHNEAIISIQPHLTKLDPYLFKVLPDLARSGNIVGAVKGATLNRESISNILIPLPPLPEQHRIVAKVKELMTLLDQLETTQTTADITRDNLLESLLLQVSTLQQEKTTAHMV